MKKIILMSILLMSIVTVSAQVASTTVLYPNTFGKVVSPTASAKMYKISGTVAGYILFKAPMNSGSKQDFTIRLDSVGGDHTNVAVAIYGQKSALKGDWTQIGSTVNWKGTTADTIITVSNASYVYYQNFKYVFTGTGATGVTKLSSSYLKLWVER